MNPTPAIAAQGLRKSYGEQVVLDGIDLAVAPGTVYALLGPNGAGKTTTVRILNTLSRADGGTASVAGFDVASAPDHVRENIGVTGQFSALDELLTGRENLRLAADLQHLDRAEARRRIAELLEQFELTAAADRPASGYSGGMKRRLDLAMTLVDRPRVIFLDEPTTGLDPRSRRGLWEIVRELIADGVTIFLTTQYLEEADALADRIAVLDGGRIVAEGTAAELKRRVPGGHVRVEFADNSALHRLAAAHPDATRDDEALALDIPSDGSVASMRGVLDGLDDRDVRGVTVHTPDLDDVFLALTGANRQHQKETVG